MKLSLTYLLTVGATLGQEDINEESWVELLWKNKNLGIIIQSTREIKHILTKDLPGGFSYPMYMFPLLERNILVQI